MASTLCKKVFVRNLGRMSYNRCLDVQQSLQNIVNHSFSTSPSSFLQNPTMSNDTSEKKNTLLLVEHSSPVFTVSANNTSFFDPRVKSQLEHLGIELQSVSKRKEGIVWHGPGQLSIYPMIFNNNNNYPLHQNQSSQELILSIFRVIQRTLSLIGINSQLESDGIYVGKDFKEKIGDFNVFSNSMDIPGFSININPNLSYYKYLENVVQEDNPIPSSSSKGRNVTSVWNQTLNHNISIGEIVPIMLDNFSKEFGSDFIDSNRLYHLRFNNSNTNNINNSNNILSSPLIIGNSNINIDSNTSPSILSSPFSFSPSSSSTPVNELLQQHQRHISFSR